MLCKISDFEIEKLSLSKTKDATYLQADKQPFELQTDWLTLGKYPLPSKKFIENDTEWINITVPIKKNDDSYLLGHRQQPLKVQDFIGKQKIPSSSVPEGKIFCAEVQALPQHRFIRQRENRLSITSLTDFHRYLGEGKSIKIVFGFSKLWTMCEQYGFSLSVKRILLKDAINEIPEETRNAFLSDDD